VVLLGLISACALTVASSGIVSAQRYYSISINSDGATNLTGAFGTWSNITMYLGDYSNGQHINSEMWFLTTPGGFTQYLEAGLRNGFDPTDPCVCVAYEAFWADWDSSGNEFRHTIQTRLRTAAATTMNSRKTLTRTGGTSIVTITS
jgi:hypothetical protein